LSDHAPIAATVQRLSAEFPALSSAAVWAMPNLFCDAQVSGNTRGGRCDRCQLNWSSSELAYYCQPCAVIVRKERSSRAARASRKAAKVQPSGRTAVPRFTSHPLMDGGRIPADHLWLVLADEHGGEDDRYGSGYGLKEQHHDAVILTKAERRSERKKVDDDGLTADDWLARGEAA
jgi:hypothetical protein